MSEASTQQQAQSARKKNKEVFFSSPTTTPMRWVDFEEKIESMIMNRLYSVTICEQKEGLCMHRQVASNTNVQHHCFQLQCFAGFHNQSPDYTSYVFYDHL